MSPVMFKGNQILFKSGQIAMDPACCCTPVVCDRCYWCFSRASKVKLTMTEPAVLKKTDCSNSTGSLWPYVGWPKPYEGLELPWETTTGTLIRWRSTGNTNGFYLTAPYVAGSNPRMFYDYYVTLDCATGRFGLSYFHQQQGTTSIFTNMGWQIITNGSFASTCWPGQTNATVPMNACGFTATNMLVSYFRGGGLFGFPTTYEPGVGSTQMTLEVVNNGCCASSGTCIGGTGDCTGSCGGSPP